MTIDTSSPEAQRICRQFVEREVVHCVSSLISHLIECNPDDEELMNLCRVLDYGSALEDEGYLVTINDEDGEPRQYAIEEDKQKVFVARFNLPGCMPEYDPAFFQEADEAWQYLHDSCFFGNLDDESDEVVEFLDEMAEMDSPGILDGPDGYLYVVEECNVADLQLSEDEVYDICDGLPANDIDEQIEACSEFDIEPNEAEIFEHWIVSGYLARKLEERGECINHDVHGLTVWGRSTTGQAISIDSVIVDICEEMEILPGQRNEWK